MLSDSLHPSLRTLQLRALGDLVELLVEARPLLGPKLELGRALADLEDPAGLDVELDERGRRQVLPSIVRRGANRSRGEESVPSRASSPSEMTINSLKTKKAGISFLWVWSCWKALQMVAFSAAALFGSITARGRPLTKTTTSGRRVWPASVTVNWLTTSQSFWARAS
jgi:hypothetical protein